MDRGTGFGSNSRFNHSFKPPGLQPSLGLAAKAEDALDVAGEAALALLLHLVVQRREGHVVERQVEEQRLAGDGLEVRGELDQVGLLAQEGGVETEGVQTLGQRLRNRK